MAKGIKDINETATASLVLQALSKKNNINSTSKSFLGGSKPAYDIVIEKIHNWRVDDKYAFFSYYAVKAGKSKSSNQIMSGILLKNVITKIFSEVTTGVEEIYKMAEDLSSDVDLANKPDRSMFAQAGSLGGQMQLHQAKKMGDGVYNTALVYGSASKVISGGVVRLEQVSHAGAKGLNIILRGWRTQSTAAQYINVFRGDDGGDPTDSINALDQYGGEIKIDYVYSPSSGAMW